MINSVELCTSLRDRHMKFMSAVDRKVDLYIRGGLTSGMRTKLS
jgi:hypothetical protein